QFGHTVLPTRAGLVPVTLQPELRDSLAALAGVSADVVVKTQQQQYSEPLLITHRGLSGPGILQASSYWHPGDTLWIDWSHGQELTWQQALHQQKQQHPQSHWL